MELLNLHFSDCPASFILAIRPGGGRDADLLGSGRGLNDAAARATCWGEAIERLVAEREDAAPAVQLGARDVPPGTVRCNEIWCLSARQIRRGPLGSEPVSAPTWAATRRELRRPRRFCAARRHDGDMALVPRALVPMRGEGTLTDSNGLAAGPDRASAERAALLELVERDAVAIWSFNRVQRPAWPLDLLAETGGDELLHWLRGRKRKTWCLDLTHDLATPVAAAISAEPDGSRPAWGTAATMSPRAAVTSAVLEMLQDELSHALAAHRAAETGALEGPAGAALARALRTKVHERPHLLPHQDAPRMAVAAEGTDPVARVAATIQRPIYFVDLDRPGDELAVVRAIAPGLRPWWPRLARGRLQDVPRRLGWATEPIDEARIGDDAMGA